MSAASWSAVALVSFVVAVLLTAWTGFAEHLVRSLPRRRHARAVAQWAASNGWQYARIYPLDIGLGVPFEPGGTAVCTNVVDGPYHGQRCTAFEYAHELLVVMLDLPGELPFLEVAVRDAVEGLSLQHDIELESEEFNRRFRVVAADARYATAVLHPRLVEELLTDPPVSWRIRGRRLVAWRRGVLDPALVLPTAELLCRIGSAIPSFVWDDYATPARH